MSSPKEVEITIYVEPDYNSDIDVELEECMSEEERTALKKRAETDSWAWGVVCVKGSISIGRTTFEHCEYLGACSYADEAGFKEGGYYHDMVSRVVHEIRDQIRITRSALNRIPDEELSDLKIKVIP